MIYIDGEKFLDIRTKLIEGLTTDGAHHKQWALEQVLRILLPQESFEYCKSWKNWEDGIAP